MVKAGCDGVTILGVLGESNRLVDAERSALITTAIEVSKNAGRAFPVCVGTSHSGTAATVALSQMAQELGAAAVMVTPAKEAVPASATTLRTYYQRVAEGCPGLPIVLQDHPASTQVFMSAELICDITAELPEIACIKLEAVPTPTKIAKIRKLWDTDSPPAGDCTILTGLGALYAGFDMAQGTEGFMTGFAFPEILVAMTLASKRGDMDTVMNLYQRFLPLMVFEQQPGVAIRKEVYRLRGFIKCGLVRHPGGNLDPIAAVQLEREIRRSLPGLDITKPLPLETLAQA